MNADERFLQALTDLSSALREIALPSMTIGGVAVIAAGVPPQTIDIDVALQIGTAERLLISHLDDLNIDRIRDLIGEIARALDDPGRLAAFDEMLDRARKSDL